MGTLIKLIFRDLSKIFLPIFFIEILFRIFISFFAENTTITMIHSLWIMLSNFFLVLCSLYTLYMFVFSKKYFFYYTTKFNIITTLILISFLYILFLYIYYLLYSFNFLLSFEYFVPKLLSLFSFYVANIFILLLCKKLFTKKLAKTMYIISLCLLLVATTILYYYLVIYKTGVPILIGASNLKDITQIYILLIPINLAREVSNNFSNFKTTSIVLNSSFLLVSGIGLVLLRKYSKFNW